ncbi:MAG TPA: N-methyl-L-tryptophan oxidase [Chloroflexota bacterium]
MTAYDAIVVGLGAMGSAATYQLSRRGLRVLGLDAFEAGHELGSSHGESRIIRLAYYEHPGYVPLLRRAYELWAELEQESASPLLSLTGGLMIGPPDGELVSGTRASAEQHGLSVEVLDAVEVRHRFPALQPADDEVALFEPQAGFLRPERCIEVALRLASAAGALIHHGEPVRAWRATPRTIELSTDLGTYTAERLVLTCGARMSSVLDPASVPVVAERMPLFWMQPDQPRLFSVERLPVYLWEVSRDAMFYGFPHVEWPGVKVARHHSGDFCDPDTVDRHVNETDEARLRAVIQNRLPNLNGEVVSSRVCLYENSPDHHFLIDCLPEHPNVVFAGGFSGHGFKFASVVGEILADLVTGRRAMPEADFLRAARLGPQSGGGFTHPMGSG